jgi:hypothetical protein
MLTSISSKGKIAAFGVACTPVERGISRRMQEGDGSSALRRSLTEVR